MTIEILLYFGPCETMGQFGRYRQCARTIPVTRLNSRLRYMNRPASTTSFVPSPGIDLHSSELEQLFAEIVDGESEREKERILPFGVIDRIRQARLGALRLPASVGGSGSSIRELFAIIIRLSEADANVAHILRNHFSVVELLLRRPRGDQGRQWQAAVAGGAIIGLATTELDSPQVGNVTPNTTFTPDGDDYLLNGTKYYSTGTLYSDYVLVRAADASGKLGAAIVPIGRDGVELIDDWDGLGQRLTATGTTHFRNVRLKRQEIVFDAPEAGYGAPYSNTFAQLFLTAVVAGIARATLRDATALVRSRKRTFYYAPSEVPTDDPVLQQTIGQIASGAFAAESVVLAAADALDLATDAFNADAAGATELAHHAALLSAKAKIVTDDFAIRGGSLLFDVGSASATKKATNFDRHWRNARTLSSHNPTTFKARSVGQHAINGTPLPAKGFF
jgi:alkylation response protein AidB-like acyl-CoA dehydrogenase